MTEEVIIEKIREILVEEFEVQDSLIVPEAYLKENLGLDSLDYVDMVALVEQNFGILLTIKDFTGVKTFGQFCTLLVNKIQESDGKAF